MTELLNREKEFIKLNEELNKMSVPVVEPPSNDSRFQLKTKTTNASLPNQGGDGSSKPLCNQPFISARENHASTNWKYVNPRTKIWSGNETAQTKKLHDIRNVARIREVPRPRISKNDKLELCYENGRYVDSPSLEMIAQEESRSIRDDLDNEAKLYDVNDRNKLTNKERTQGRDDSLIKFLKSKVSILEEAHERLIEELTQQKTQLEKSLELNKQTNRILEKNQAKQNAICEELQKTEQQLADAKRLEKELTFERMEILKQHEAAKIKVQTLTRINGSLEKRLLRATEELEEVKSALSHSKAIEKQIQNANRAEHDKNNLQIKLLKKQRSDLLNAHRKQLYLITNLKRQNTCLEQSKKLAFIEKEFDRLLDWNKKA